MSSSLDIEARPLAQTHLQLLDQMRAAGYDAHDVSRVVQAYRFVSRLFANQFRACGKPFVCHLVGTAAVLAWLRAPGDVVVAGLLHAVYQEGDFPGALPGITARKRREVRDAFGDAVESLVAAYTEGSRSLTGILDSHSRFDSMSEFDRTVLLMQLANEYDDYRDGAAGYAADAATRIDKAGRCADAQVDMARRLGFPAFAEALRGVYDRTATAGTWETLQSEHANAYAIRPASCVTAPHNLMLRAIRKARRITGLA